MKVYNNSKKGLASKLVQLLQHRAAAGWTWGLVNAQWILNVGSSCQQNKQTGKHFHKPCVPEWGQAHLGRAKLGEGLRQVAQPGKFRVRLSIHNTRAPTCDGLFFSKVNRKHPTKNTISTFKAPRRSHFGGNVGPTPEHQNLRLWTVILPATSQNTSLESWCVYGVLA